MGSSPVTATTDSPVLKALQGFLRQHFPQAPPRHILVAFSGGADSTCLLWGLRQLSRDHDFRLTAAHFDHRLDPQSSQRAADAERLAQRLDVPCVIGVAPEEGLSPQAPDGGLEASARRLRYAFLDDLAARLSADAIATAHHLDDQAETVLLRTRFGSGIEGLAGIQPRFGQRIRPLLGMRQRQLELAMEELGLPILDDPTNRDLRRPRNFIRHRVLPHLTARQRDLPERLSALADSARRARHRIDQRLRQRLKPQTLFLDETVAIDRQRLLSLPEPLLPHALALLARLNGAAYPISAEARAEALRQMQSTQDLGCDCGHGWRLEGHRTKIWMRPEKPSAGDFAYTLEIPGAVAMPSLDLVFAVHCGLDLPESSAGQVLAQVPIGRLRQGQTIQIRNRRPGDRLWPSGNPRERRLNDVLTDHRVPRFWRDRLPLLVVDGNIAWVPGVTISDSFREEDTVLKGRDTLGRASDAWILTLERPPRPIQKSVAVRALSDDGSKERSKP